MSRGDPPRMVFIAVGPGHAGSAYHRLPNCAAKGGDQAVLKLSRNGAEGHGYEPCGVCIR